MANLAVLYTQESGENSLIDINNNFALLNQNKLPIPGSTLTVGAQGQYADIQSALNAAPSTGCIIQLLDPEYDITSTLLFKSSDTVIVGTTPEGTIISCDGSVVTTMIKADPTATPQTLGRCGLRNVGLFQSNVTPQGIGLDASDMSLNLYDNVSITGFGTAVKINDTTNYTFFNRFSNFKIFLCNNGIDITSTNPANDNMFDNIRISLNVGGAGFGFKLTNGLDNSIYNMSIDLSATIGTGNTGIILQSSGSEILVRHNNFFSPYVENAGTLVTIATARENAFYGGAFIWGAQTSTGVTDNGTGTGFYGTRVDTALNTITTRNSFGSPTTSTDLGSTGTSVYQNNNQFAHITNPLIEMKLINGSDTSTVLKLNNNGVGMALDVKGGTLNESVTNTTLSADVNDYKIDSIVASGSSTFFRLAATGNVNITGIGGTSTGTSSALIDGRIIYIRNTSVATGSANLVLKNQSASSLAANRFAFSTGADITVSASGSASLMYDSTTARWFDIK